MSDLTCPKCQSPMRSYERNNVTIDQCTGCRGIFLDRGELERLVDAEGSFYEQRGLRPRQHDDDDDDHLRREYERGYGFGGHPAGKHKRHKRKKESFLGDLLDFG